MKVEKQKKNPQRQLLGFMCEQEDSDHVELENNVRYDFRSNLSTINKLFKYTMLYLVRFIDGPDKIYTNKYSI